MLGLSLWVIGPAMIVWGVDLWLYRRLDVKNLVLLLGWILLMLVVVLTIQ